VTISFSVRTLLYLTVILRVCFSCWGYTNEWNTEVWILTVLLKIHGANRLWPTATYYTDMQSVKWLAKGSAIGIRFPTNPLNPSIPDLGATYLLPSGTGGSSLRGKEAGEWSYHSPKSSAEVKSEWNFIPRHHGIVLKHHKFDIYPNTQLDELHTTTNTFSGWCNQTQPPEYAAGRLEGSNVVICWQNVPNRKTSDVLEQLGFY